MPQENVYGTVLQSLKCPTGSIRLSTLNKIKILRI